jgi:hypothetical protein
LTSDNTHAAGSAPSPVAIAKALNAESIPGPEGRVWRDTTVRCHAARGTGILLNELYVGRLIWNRTHFVKDPSTGKRISRMNPPEQWVAEDVPHLRIIDQDLWARVQKPYKRLLVDVTASKENLDKALTLANDLFNALESVDHRVVIAPANEGLRRRQTEERETATKPRDDWQIIEQWSNVMGIERFLSGVEQKASSLPEIDRLHVLDRLALARSFLGKQDPLDFLRSWKTPEERYTSRYQNNERETEDRHSMTDQHQEE